jgi:broad specificity phosphatase PhoE
MPPKLILIRHAQALHNAGNKCNPSLTPYLPIQAVVANRKSAQQYHLPDPLLTKLGRDQAQELQNDLEKMFKDEGIEVNRIIVSPLRRCIETAQIALSSFIGKIPFEADADWQGK